MKTCQILFLLFAAVHLDAGTSLVRGSRVIMGTYCEIQVYDSNEGRAEAAIRTALDEIARVDRLLSNYNSESELSIMNREASRNPFQPSAELFRLMTACRRFYDNSGGTFDPTVGALVRAWGFYSRQPGIPGAAEIAAAKAASGFDKVRIDPGGRTIRYDVERLEVDPGGIGKGYAVDKAMEVLKKLRIGTALVSVGGSSMRGIGHPPGQRGWRVAISNPDKPGEAAAVVELRDASLSTSGVARQALQTGSHTYSHIFDPRTGEPVENMCQATVVASDGMTAEALSKPAFILSRQGLSKVLKRYPGSHAMRLEGSCAGGTGWVTPWSKSIFTRPN